MTWQSPPLTVESATGPECARLRLGTPDGRNALGQGLAEELLHALDRAENTPACRALVVSSSTAYFCSGLDLPSDGRPPPWLDARRSGPLDVFGRIARSPLVTIAVVEGPAIGGGVGLAASCDIVVVSDKASFRLTETVIGLTPKVIMPYLTRRTGSHRAFTLALTGAETGPREACAIGLADHHDPTPEARVRQVLASVRRTDPHAVRVLKADHNRLHLPTEQAHAQAALELKEAFAHDQVHTRLAELRSVGALP
ncbi:1,4-dihydroxy-2-naphthoyl-CoA synthase [Streptomyces avidinii]